MRITVLTLLLACAGMSAPAFAQQVRVGDIAGSDVNVPIRVVGYGLVVGLDGTGDRALGGFGARHTVQSVVNLLRNFGVQVPAEVLRTRNVAAVLVTAESSPYLRAGGRFEVSVASIGDAVSLRGGVLWMTPLVYEAGGEPIGNAQGPLLVSASRAQRGTYTVETSARIPDGGLLLADLPREDLASGSRIVLHVPNIATASRIADAINGDLGPNTARVEDPGSVVLAPADSAGDGPATRLARILDLQVDAGTRAQILVDSRDGTVVAGGQITVGPAVVSHGGLTLTVASTATGQPTPGEVRVASGASVQDVAAALHGVGAPAEAIAAIFESLHSVGALVAEVRIR